MNHDLPHHDTGLPPDNAEFRYPGRATSREPDLNKGDDQYVEQDDRDFYRERQGELRETARRE